MHVRIAICRSGRLAAGLLLFACAGAVQAAAFASADLFLSLAVSDIRNLAAAPVDAVGAVQVRSRTAVFEDLRNATGPGASALTDVALWPAPPDSGGGALSIEAATSASVPLGGLAVASLAADGLLELINTSVTDSFAVDVLIELAVALAVGTPAAVAGGESVALVQLFIESEHLGYVLDDVFLAISPGLPGGSFADSFTRTLVLGPNSADAWTIVADALSYAAPLPGSAALLWAGLLGLTMARRRAAPAPSRP